MADVCESQVYGGESEVVKDRVAAALTTHLKASIERSGDRSRHNLEMEEELQRKTSLW